MPGATLPPQEVQRLAALASYDVLDTACEENFDDLTRLAARLTGSPTALISLIDQDRQWFKSKVGLDASETHRDQAFCAHAIHHPDEALVVEDATADPAFADNVLVTGPLGLRFYAGVPLVSPSGHAIGTLCVLDYTKRTIAADALEALKVLARCVMTTLELRRVMSELCNQALSDALTGLPNRVAFAAALSQAIARQRRDGLPATLLFVDLDGFKRLNTSFGHAVGDAALTEMGRLLRALIRQEDTAARLGGDEFAILLVGGDGTEARLVAERIRAEIERSMAARGWPITASIGAVTFVDAPRDETTALAVADIYLYAAKNSGRNRVSYHNYVSVVDRELITTLA